MFEKVFIRLCPCYYARIEDGELLWIIHKDQNKSLPELEDSKRHDSYVYSRGCDESVPEKEHGDSFDYWNGTISFIYPQPIYNSPLEKVECLLYNQILLRPDFYWKRKTNGILCKSLKFPDCERKQMGTHLGRRVKTTVAHHKCSAHRSRELSVLIGYRLYPSKKVAKTNRSESSVIQYLKSVSDFKMMKDKNETVRLLISQSAEDISLSSTINSSRDGKHIVNSETTKSSKQDRILRRSMQECIISGLEKFSNDLFHPFGKCSIIPDISYGVIVFSAAYHSKKKLILLKIDRLENLSLKGRHGYTYSTIIKLAVPSSDRDLKCSKVLKKSSSPDVRENFTFTVKEISSKILRLSVFDALSQNSLSAIGHALLSLDGITSRHPKKFRMKLYRHTQPHITPGNLAVTIGYWPEEGKLGVLVGKARNLSLQKDKNVKLNTYVKASLYSCGSKLKSKRSVLVTNTKDPTYNSVFTFRVEEDDIDDLLIVISVKLESFLKDKTLGRVIIGPFFIMDHNKLTPWGRVFLKGEFVSHWFRMYL